MRLLVFGRCFISLNLESGIREDKLCLLPMEGPQGEKSLQDLTESKIQ